MHSAYLSLGSNLESQWGKPKDNLRIALEKLKNFSQVEAQSSIYTTEPQNFRDQPWFMNQVISVQCEIEAIDLLHRLQQIEKELGRIREKRFGPRVIDLDILLFDNEEKNDAELILPHPRLKDRAFVLIPLCEIAPDIIVHNGHTARAMLEKIQYRLDGQCIYQSITPRHGEGLEKSSD